MNPRPPHLLPGQSPARQAQLLAESPLESWHHEVAQGGMFSADKLAALFLVLGLIFSQVGFIATPAAEAAVPVAVADAYVVDEGGSLSTVGGAWHLADWRLRRTITFNNAGRSQLDNFPVLVRLDPADIDYARTQGSGQDLRFIDSDGTPLPYEIEAWNSGSVSNVWVRVPRIDAGSTTDFIWMYYDNDLAGHAQDASGVWSNGYVGVWHMNQDPGASQILDSTSYLNHGSSFNMDGSNSQPGQIGNALSFDGAAAPNAEYLRVPSDGADELSMTGTQVTLEALVRRTGSTGDWQVAIGRQLSDGSADSLTVASRWDTPDVATIVAGDSLDSSAGAVPANEWRYLAGVRDGGDMFVYSNGGEVGQSTGLVSSIATDANDVTIGAQENDATANPDTAWLGLIDEVRISNISRSVDWITAQNASMTDTLATYGSEEEAGLLANDTDPEGDPMTVALGTGPAHAASFTLNADGSFDYTPAAGMSGTDSFTYVANDGSGDSNVATVTITVTATGPNNPPDAIDDPSATTDRDVAVAIDVLGNDSDPDTDPLTISAASQGSNGSVVNNGTDVTYTPDPGWTGVDSFTYEASDSNGGFDTATVTVTVSPPAGYSISGTVFEDIAGDVLNDGVIGDASNPGAVGVDAYLYEDTNANTILDVGTDTLVAGPVATNGSGAYSFSGLADLTDYFVRVDSTTVPSSQDPTALQGDLWAEQTYAPADTWCANGGGSASQLVADGPCYGGLNSTFSDNASFPEHYTMVSISGANATGVNYGFSHNVVVNTLAGDGTDHDVGANRTVQGSLRQFVQNANAISGANAMRFVPAVPANDGTWWEVFVSSALPVVTDAGTTIDGTAYQLSDGGTVRNTNGGYLGANAAGGVMVGVDNVALPQVEAPELEIQGDQTAPSPPQTGFVVQADSTTVRRLAIYGFGDHATAGTDANIQVGPSGGPAFEAVVIEQNVIGSAADGFGDPGLAARTDGNNVYVTDAISGGAGQENRVRDNLIGFAYYNGVMLNTNTGGWLVTGNEIRAAGLDNASGPYMDTLAFEGTTSSGHSAIGNLITQTGGPGIDTWLSPGGNTIENNGLVQNGSGGAETAGLRIFGTGSTVSKNVITTNTGPGVIVVGERPITVPTWSAASGNLISQNQFGTNTGIAIDLVESTDLQAAHSRGDGVTLTAGTLATTGNNGVDAPVIASSTPTTVSGAACANCDVEVYRAVAGVGDDFAGTDYGEGVEYLGTATANGSGDWTLTGITALNAGDEVSAITVDGSNTSEFGANALVVANGVPSAVPGGPYSTDEGEDLILDGSGSSDPDTDPLSYNWDIDNDGSYDDATGVNPTVPWLTLVGLGFDDDGGPYPIGLEVDDGNGHTDTATVNWTIANTPPVVSVTGSGTVGRGMVYTANLSVTDPGNDTVTEWTINWGDGDIETLPGNPALASHTYANPGEYNVTAAVEDEDSLLNRPWHNDRMVVPGLFANEQLFRLEATSGAVVDNLATGSGQGWAITAIIGPDGLAYVGDYTGDSIRRYNPVTGADLGVWIPAGTGGLNGPAGMQFGPDGHLYVSSNFGDEILEFDTDGTFLGVFASGGGLDEPDDLTFGPDGHLYVTSFNTDEVLKYNGRDGNPMGVFASGAEIDQPSELVFGPGGKLYVTSVANDQVVRYNADGSFDAIFATAGATGLNEPRGATFGPDGHLYVGGRNRIVRYDGSSGALMDVYLPSGSISGPSQSSFIPAKLVTALPLIVNSTGDASDSNLGDGVCYTGNVNSATDAECTLRAAIEEANAFPGTDTINFDMPVGEPGHSGGVWTISPLSDFDQLTGTVIIDGTTQPGWTSTPVVEINGSGAVSDGFRIAADEVEIHGLAINRFPADGIEVASGAANVVIAANHIGLDATGLIDRGNVGRGIDLGSGSGPTRVGGGEATHRNLISGNGGDGIIIWNSNANTIFNNYIGTDITGLAAIGNGADGVALGGTSASNLIGQVGDLNVLSGNANDGVENDATGANNAVYYNIIGLGINADTLVPNGRYGVVMYNGANNTFVYQNLIAGNTSSGVVIDGNGNAATTANNVIGNWIGLNLVDQPRPNGGHGVHIFGGATSNVIGGTPAAYRNIISGNGVDGIHIAGAATSGNQVENNHIGTNIGGDAAVPNGDNGIRISGAPNNTVGGNTVNHRNVVSGNGNNGILLDAATATGNIIQGNYFGLNAAGDAAVPNADEGVDLSDAPGNTVGGTSAAARNVISGNGDIGVLLIGAGTAGNSVSANYIGTNAAGDAPIANGRSGVYIEQGASSNMIGGATAGHRNIISGNVEDGIYITSLGTTANTVTSNYIGTNAAGDAAIPNGDRGVQIESGASGNLVGVTAQGNVISGNTGDGVIVADFLSLGTTDNEVVDNLIGVSADGTTPLGNGANGVHLDPVSDTLIQGNTIANNGQDGVVLETVTLAGNSIVGNSIHGNGQLGIDIGNNNVDTNDPLDGDGGANEGMNYPEPTGATESGGTITLDFDLDVPAGTYWIDVFANPNGTDLSGNGEGELWRGGDTITSAGSGTESFSITIAGSAGDVLTATTTRCVDGAACTDPGSTSEFSVPITVVSDVFVVNSTGDADDANPGNGVCDTGGTNTQGAAECTIRAAIREANAIAGASSITFDMPATELGHIAGVWTISPVAALPTIGLPADIDATTQTGYGGQPIVRIDGNSSVGVSGFTFGANADASTLAGVMITRFDVDGIVIAAGSVGVSITDSWIGSDGTGNAAAGNGDDGIDINGGGAIIDSNVVNHNGDEGIDVRATGVTITGSIVGLEADGASGTGNGDVGIAVFADGATIGGATIPERNVISNNFEGIEINSSNNVVEGNYIGTDSGGTLDRGNHSDDGVEIQVGTNNRIGGPTSAQANRIAFNQRDGVYIVGGSGSSILRNIIHDNGGLGIDLGPDGVTPNGPGDPLNFPVIDSAVIASPWITVSYTIDAPAGDYVVEFFSNPSGTDPTGYGEGEAFEYRDAITHPGGSASYVAVFSGFITDVLTATLTEDLGGSYGSTSEFSGTANVTAGTLVVNSGGNSGDMTPGDAACDTGSTITGGDPECTLDAAVQEANTLGGSIRIEFAIPDTDPLYRNLGAGLSYWRIQPTASITPITGGAITIDATTQTSYAVGQGYFVNDTGPEVEINGSTGVGGNGLEIQSSNNEIRGFVINRFVTGVAVWSGDGNVIAGNYLGPDPSGANGLVGNTNEGIEVDGATDTVIGGTAVADRNVVSGNRLRGVAIDTDSPATAGTQIIGNYIGTNAAGDASLLYDATNVQQIGVYLLNAPDTVVGTAADGNVISGNSWFGVYGWGPNATGTVIQGNIIGLDATGSFPVPNATDLGGGRAGISLSSIPGALIGGDLGGESNIIAENGEYGVVLHAAAATSTSVIGNQIYANADLGIDLGGDGVSVNAPGDPLNFPEITSATESGGPVTVNFDLDVPAGDYRIEFFVNPSGADLSGYGEGETLVHSYNVVAHPGGLASYSTTFAGSTGDILTATTTEETVAPFGSTSEFSAAVTVTFADTTPPVITLVGANPQVIEVGSPYTELGATALDDVDGDISGSIVIDASAVNTAALGSYLVTYNVSDSAGNPATEVTRTVDVVDTTAPVLTLLGSNPLTIEVGSPYVEAGATAADNYDGDLTGSIVINSAAVNTAVVGSYVVTYDVVDSSGNPASGFRTVNVVDTTSPVITLVGASPQTIEVGSPYVELGATATDNYDGDITGSIVINSSAVNTALVGSYSVTYDVSDSEGNAAVQVTRTVDVVDTTVPVIALVGPNPQILEVGSPYVELGATAFDVGDGDLTGSIVINASAVNTTVVGGYVVTYNVSDSSGNPAVQVTRTVDVVDTTVPVIALVGPNPQILEVGSPYVELGATATDNYDGDLTGSIVIDASAVNTGVVGSYVVTYNVSDSSGNPAVQVVRNVDVVDTTIPVISLVGANPQILEVGSPYVELGATAFDTYDGDITGSIVIDATGVDGSTVGSYSVTYDVTDSQGNPAIQVVRTVDVVDTTAPAITLVGANPQTIEVGSPYIELGATAWDVGDGDISGSIVIDATAVNTAVVGSYIVTYDVTDSQGNPATQVVRTVEVVDTTLPVITLLGANPQTIEVGSPYVELGATATDNYDGDLTGLIVIDASAVNTAVVGSYTVTYDVTDSNGNAAVQVSRTVDVVDTTIPVTTLVGANPQVIEVGSPYVELGATAADNYDGDLTGSIVINASAVNTAVVGSYSVTYDVSDTSGNAAVQVTRTVDVVDTTAPVITLLGANPQTIEVGSPYVELGANVLDNYDGDITGSIVIDTSGVNMAVVGSYVVTYDVTDSNGNAAVQVTRTVDVVDTTAPVITLVGSNPQQIEVGSPYGELGATAFDNYDGDITGLIVIDATAVNTAVVGSYAVTYDVTDSNGNAAVQVTRTVDVVDTTAPIVTLLGANPQTIEVGSPYVELGATAFDNYDGDITGSIVIDASAVNTAVVGSYLVTYDVTDSEGNPATQVVRTVDVVDTTAPVITLVGANPQTIEVGSPYVELGATAFDNYDGDITGSIVIDASGVNPAVVGSYVVTYNVTDSEGNPAVPVVRTVDVVDTTAPVLTLLGANPQTIEVGTPYAELGATATDNYDGDLTGSVVIDASAVNTAVVGSYVVSYTVADSAGNPAFGFRTVDVVDTTAPIITMLGANPQTIEVGSPYVELGATAFDNYDGDITGSIVIDASAVNNAVVGSYTVTYDVTDSNGNPATQVVRTVDIVDTTRPVITLLGANPQTINVTSPYVEMGATALDGYDGDITGSIVVDASAVNTAVVGSYPVTYDVADSNGNPAIQVIRTVNVINVAPSLGLLSNQTVAEMTPLTFTATASDPDPTDGLLYSLVGAPSGASIDPVSGVFAWTPTEAQGPNSYIFDVVVTDSGTPPLADSQTITVTVTEANLQPTLNPIPPQVVDEQTLLSFVATAGDPDVPANGLTFILTGAPAGAAIDPATGVFTWIPTEAQGPGGYGFDVVVSDNGTPSLSDTQPVTVTVNEANLAPNVVDPGPQTGAEADSIVLGIAASDADIPANTLTYSATGLPDGLSINPATGAISGIIDYTANASSPFAVTVTVTDNGSPALATAVTFSWTVADTNRSPLALDDFLTVAEDSAQILDVLANDSDPDADPVNVTGVAVPAHGSATVAGGGIRYVPDANYNGSDSFVYSISDGRGGFASATVNLTVTPVNDAPSLNVLSSLNVDEQTPAVFVASATDVEGDNVFFSLGGAPSGAFIDPVSGAFTWTPAEDQGPASYTFDVIATDDGSPVMATSRQVLVNVAEVNVAPVFVNPGNQFSAENETVSLAVVAVDADFPAGSVAYSATGLPPGLSINPASGEIAGLLPFDAAAASPYVVTLTATDDGAPQRSGQATFSWFVGNTNRAPIALDISVFAEAGVPAPFVLNGSDPDGDLLTFQIVSGPTQGALTGGPRMYDYTPVVTAGGTDIFSFTVSDGDLVDTGTVTVSITPNLAPSGGADEYVVRRGGVLVIDAPGVLGNDQDPEGRPITAIVDSQPAHGALTLQTDGSFTYNNRGDEVDLDLFTYRLDDGMRVSEPIRVLLIVEENLAPVVQNDMVTLDEDDTLVFSPMENDHDPNGEQLLVSDVVPPEHGSVDWSLDGAFIYRPDQNWNGTETFTYEVTDGDLTGSGTITLQVVPVNDAPVALSATMTGSSGEVLTVDLRPYASDVDGDPLEFILESPPAGAAKKIEPGVFAIDLDGVIKDLPPLAFIVSDPFDATAASLLTIAVKIPAELVGVPSLVSNDIDRGPAPGASEEPAGDPPGGPALVSGLRLMVGSVLDTFRALRMPVFVLVLFVIASLFLGLSRKFAFSSTATVLPLGGRKKVDIVMAQSQAGVPARAEPGIHQSVAYRFAPDEVGIVTTGARMMVRSEVWVEVETSEGDAWVDAAFLTEQQSRAMFLDDLRVRDLVSDLVDQIYSGGDLLEVTGGHDLHVAFYGPPVRFAASSLRRLLSGASVYWWWGPDGDTPRHQGTFAETVGGSLGAAYRNCDAHQLEPMVPIPIEFANMHSLVVGHHELGEGWRIFFRYQDDEPLIAGLMRDVAPNPASMHGLVGV